MNWDDQTITIDNFEEFFFPRSIEGDETITMDNYQELLTRFIEGFETITMEDHQELSAISIPGVNIKSYAIEHASSSSDNRSPDDFFTVKLCCQDSRNPVERSWTFRFPKESDVFYVFILYALSIAIDRVGILAHGVECVFDVIVESCEKLLLEVADNRRKSLAMVVNLKLNEQLLAGNMDMRLYQYIEYDLDYLLEVWMENIMEEYGMEAKSFLSSNDGVKFINGDQTDTDNMGSCSICLDEFEKLENNGDHKDYYDVAVLSCSHAFHVDCLVPWIAKGKNTCPLCRFDFLPY